MILRISLKRAIVALLGLGILGTLFAWSGAMQISASSGHWRITDWFLHWTMRNSVRTYAWLDAPPDPLDDEGLVSAAGHFRQACQVCHGAPGVRPSPVMQQATPPAPDLARTAGEWRDRELFWIIRHGVKFTGMPAWAAADRPDEVRRMTAFVRRLPQMTAAQYQALTQAGEERRLPGVAPATLSACTSCHGVDGQGQPHSSLRLDTNTTAMFPTPLNLVRVIREGLPERDLAHGERMQAMPGFADQLSHEDMADLVNYMRQTWGGRPGDVTAAQVAEHVKTIEHSK